MILSLTGFMGCGKSSVARELSALMDCPLVDLDAYIEEREGRTIPEIFKEGGEALFREKELSALREVVESDMDRDIVLSLGGGALTLQESRDIVHEMTFCIYLKAQVDTLVGNLLRGGTSSRPMLSEEKSLREQVEGLLSRRKDIYEGCARMIIATDGKSFREVAEEISRELGE